MSETVIVRLPNWLGDTVMAVPALRALRAGFPSGRIALAGPWATLLAGQDVADVLIAYPRAWAGRLPAADAVRALRPDLAVLFPNSLEAAAAALYWRARRRLGFGASGRRWLLTDRVAVPMPRRHQVDEYLLLVERLGLAVPTREPRLAPPPPQSPARGAARALLDDAGLRRNGGASAPLVGVHLGAEFGPSKRWPTERIVEFCRRLGADGAVPVLLGPPADGALAKAVRAEVPVASLVGRDRPELLPALLSELDAVVCGDTGVGHLAAALGRPVVTLFGPTDSALTAPRGRAEVVRHPTPCAPCFYRDCPIDHPCMQGIEARQVQERVRSLLG